MKGEEEYQEVEALEGELRDLQVFILIVVTVAGRDQQNNLIEEEITIITMKNMIEVEADVWIEENIEVYHQLVAIISKGLNILNMA